MTDLVPRSTASSPPPRQARARVTREAILDAAAVEFSRAGYHAASLSGILERSGVTKGALYFHFASKETMALALVESMEERFPLLVAEVEGRGHDALTTCVHLAVGLADLVADEVAVRAGLRLTAEGAAGPDRTPRPYRYFVDAFSALLARAAREGSLRDDVDLDAAAHTMVALGVGHRTLAVALGRVAAIRGDIEASFGLVVERMAAPAWLAEWAARGGAASVPAPPDPHDGGA